MLPAYQPFRTCFRSVAGNSYHQDLARQVADFLDEPLQKSHGVMTLTDVYCLYNAARGIGEPNHLLLQLEGAQLDPSAIDTYCHTALKVSFK